LFNRVIGSNIPSVEKMSAEVAFATRGNQCFALTKQGANRCAYRHDEHFQFEPVS
jgi:hypothetical protein